MPVRLLLAALSALTLAACAVPAPIAPLDAVLEADRAFARHAAAHGAQAAFMEYAAENALMFVAGVGPVRGRAAIGQVFAGDAAQPAWTPEGGDIAASGDLAWTWGAFTWTPRSGDAKPATGYYVTVWKRIDGRWRWVGDLGVPAPHKPAP